MRDMFPFSSVYSKKQLEMVKNKSDGMLIAGDDERDVKCGVGDSDRGS